jgi:hypothetical protein
LFPSYGLRFMAGTRASTGVLSLAACVALWCVLPQCARAQEGAPTHAASSTTHFNIPAQDLRRALQSYISLTDLSIMVPNGMLPERTSAAVQGDYTSREALERMLQGTGLEVHFIGDHLAAITRFSGGAGSAIAVPTGPSVVLRADELANVNANGMNYEPYIALIQDEVHGALCASSVTRPGEYRLLVQFQVASSGALTDIHLLGSTGTQARDAEIMHVLRSTVLDLPPPLGMPEPVSILFRPQGNGVVARCPAPISGG